MVERVAGGWCCGEGRSAVMVRGWENASFADFATSTHRGNEPAGGGESHDSGARSRGSRKANL